MDSVLSQEGVSLEFIIIDDGSTDGTNGALANYARHDTRVRSLTRALIKGKMEQKARLTYRSPGQSLAIQRSDICLGGLLLNLQQAVLFHLSLGSSPGSWPWKLSRQNKSRIYARAIGQI